MASGLISLHCLGSWGALSLGITCIGVLHDEEAGTIKGWEVDFIESLAYFSRSHTTVKQRWYPARPGVKPRSIRQSDSFQTQTPPCCTNPITPLRLA